MKCNAFAREEKVRKFSIRFIESVKSPNGCVLGSNHEMHEAFRVHFCDRKAEAISCEGLVTEFEVRDALKQVGLNKLPGLNGLPYEVYLRLPQMFVPIVTDMFINWIVQEPSLVALPRA